MSVILVTKDKNKIVIDSDSQETSNMSCQENVNYCKLKKIGDESIYIADAGDAHVGTLLYAYAEKHSLSSVESSWDLIEYFKEFKEWLSDGIFDDTEDNQDLLQRCQFILVINDKVWHFTNFYVREVKEGEFTSIGSGSQSALTGIHLGATVEEALIACCKVNVYCSEPLNVIEIKL